MSASYGQPTAPLPPLNEVEVDLLRRAVGIAINELNRRADDKEPGSTMRQHYQGQALVLESIGRKLSFPDRPEQW